MDINIRCVDNEDIEDIARLANNYTIASTTSNLPHPYTIEHAKIWLDYVQDNEKEHVFAVCLGDKFIGVVGLVHEAEHKRAELGYWLGQDYWNKGYMSIAANMAVAYAFSVLDIHKIYSKCFSTNAASRKILEKNKFTLEGCLEKHFIRLGDTKDILCFGLLRENYEKGR